MASTSAAMIDEGIRVVVTPSQASYFAGEAFSVTITFTNTRTPEAPAAPRSASHAHRRGAHSISSVPLARPPTSPGTPRTVVPVFTSRANGESSSTRRKGLIGHGVRTKLTDEPPSVEVLRKRLLASRSLSVSLAPHELPQDPTSEAVSPASAGPSSVITSPVGGPPSARIIAPLARSPSLPPNHPHARKNSVLDGQLQLQDFRPPPSPSSSLTPNPSTSTFSLSLDPIAEAGSVSPGPPATPSFPSPIPGTDIPNIRTQILSIGLANHAPKTNGTHVYPAAAPREPGRRPSHLGIGHGPPPSSSSTAYLKPPRSAFSSAFPPSNTELILYAYAQLLGTLTLTPLPDANASPEHTRALGHLRSQLLKRKAVGGGSMDISSSLSAQSLAAGGGPPGRRGSHGRSSSLSAGLFSMLSPSSLVASPSQEPFVPGHKARTSSVFSLFSNGQAPAPSRSGGVGLGLSTPLPEEEDVDPDAPLPTLEVQPSMLAVDLTLGPGESRTYTYTLVLPENLPPTFRGRALKFSYQFIMGVCRAGSGVSAPGAGPSSNSRVMKVPIRMYNNVSVSRPLRPYDMLWPVTAKRGPLAPGKVTEEPKEAPKRADPRSSPRPGASLPGSYEDLQGYARDLLASFPDPTATGVRIKLPIEAIQASRSAGLRRELEDELDTPTECRHAVEILTRNPKKASYDVTKDGIRVAVLTFPKSAYRLGETILGVVETNERASRARVLKLSAMLEAHESLPSNIASPALARHLRRVHAEHHSCFMPATLRTTFALDIPPDASPAFQASLNAPVSASNPGRSNPPRPGGLEWKVRLCLLVTIASPTAREGVEGVRLRQLVRDGAQGQWGSSWKAAQSIAPLERPGPPPPPVVSSPTTPMTNGELTAGSASTALSWMSYFASSLLGPSNVGYHDGDEDLEEEGEDEVGPEEAWKNVKVEMVECEVPVRVWPGNTAFKATEIVFDV